MHITGKICDCIGTYASREDSDVWDIYVGVNEGLVVINNLIIWYYCITIGKFVVV